MKQSPRIYYTDTDKALMFERWRKGEPMQKIAEMSGRNRSQEYILVDVRHHSSTSIGTKLFYGEIDPNDILRQADAAMYKSKKRSK